MRSRTLGRNSDSTDRSRLVGLRVFAVEDESIVAMQLEDILADLGCDLVELAMRLRKALDRLAEEPEIDAAVLDVNIAGEKIYPVAERLRARGVPIVFATGYGRGGLQPEWQDCEVIQKPYTEAQIADALMRALGAVPVHVRVNVQG
ncbi:response regulator [Aureimonas sp. AU4]|uniref:response regulator n=1 Tax=Aureimonas sp. AU4 TaxID=1638163 RepID=UPI000783658A|nr:response regulator [Aureimonas sp. AU4]